MSPLLLEGLLYWAAVTLYAAAAVLYLVALVFRNGRVAAWATGVTAAALPVHAIAILARWAAVGHGPYINRYEVFSADVWVAIAMFLVLQYRLPSLQALGAAVLPIGFLFMGFGALSSRQPEPLTPALRSYWLVLHVLFAKLAFGAILLSFGLALVYLLKQRTMARGWVGYLARRPLVARMPSPERLDDLGYRYLGLGFLLLAIMIIAGSIWANEAWGTYWNWDPIEVWALAAWLTYGVALHLRVTYGWRGARAAGMTLLSFAVSLISFFGVAYVARSIHVEYLVR